MNNTETPKKSKAELKSGLTPKHFNLNKLIKAMKKIQILFAVLSIVLSSCFSSIMDDDYTSIDPELQQHVNAFVSEAQSRGIYIDTYSLKVVIKSIEGRTSGRCFYETNTIWIDTAKTKNIEALVFHELGHMYLHRDHDNKMYGMYCKSIMSDQSDPVYDKPYKREYYIKELFNETEPEPFWISGSVID